MPHCKQTGYAMLLASFLLAGCGPSDREPVELAQGQEPYLRYCASCHGNDGEGKPPRFPPLSEAGWAAQLPAEGLALIVLYGLRGDIEVAGSTYRGFMPPMRHLSDIEIAELIGFMETRWAERESTLQPADVGHLREVLSGRSVLEGRSGVHEALESIE